MLSRVQAPLMVSTNTMLTDGEGLVTDCSLLAFSDITQQQGKRGGMAQLLQPDKVRNVGFPLSLCWWRWGHGFFYSVQLEQSSCCLKGFSCQAMSFLVLWLEKTGFSQDSLYPWAFLGFWLFQYPLCDLWQNKQTKHPDNSPLCFFPPVSRCLASLPSCLHLSVILDLFWT